jgi:hypothetical protein
MRRSFLVLLLVATACGAPKVISRLPSEGGPAWRELTSQHFVLWTAERRQLRDQLCPLITDDLPVDDRAIRMCR